MFDKLECKIRNKTLVILIQCSQNNVGIINSKEPYLQIYQTVCLFKKSRAKTQIPIGPQQVSSKTVIIIYFFLLMNSIPQVTIKGMAFVLYNSSKQALCKSYCVHQKGGRHFFPILSYSEKPTKVILQAIRVKVPILDINISVLV